MKKIFSAILVFFLWIGNTVAFADTNPNVSIDIKGNIEVGQSIQILINVSNIKNLYAGAAKFKYDKNILKVTGFEKGDLVSKSEINVFDAGNSIDNDNGVAEFGGFSCLGQLPGFSGSGTFLIIDAQVLKKDSFHINSVPLLSDPNDDNNLKIQLIDNNIKDINYNFTGYDFKLNSDGSITASKSGSGNNGDHSKATATGSAGVDAKNNNESINTLNKDNSENKVDDTDNAASGKDNQNSSSSTANSAYSESEDNASNNVSNDAARGNSSSNIGNKNDSSKESSGNNENGISQNSSKAKNSASSNRVIEAGRKNNIYIVAGISAAVILILCFMVFKFILKKKIYR
ncbi:MAG: cohesin domain-containing protein [Clostridium sp.]|uniref:cohesin domain-containing protein n=1 Tax=Clostridium sp. TaxID=1506 RepID=UPI0039EAA616